MCDLYAGCDSCIAADECVMSGGAKHCIYAGCDDLWVDIGGYYLRLEFCPSYGDATEDEFREACDDLLYKVVEDGRAEFYREWFEYIREYSD